MNEIKERIVDEAAVMFRNYGIRSVTMDMLASSLGMSKRTIYEHFRDKDEMLVSVVRHMEVKRIEMVERTIGESPDVICAIFTLLKSTGDHFRSMNPVFFTDLKRYQPMLEKHGVCGLPDLSGSLTLLERGKSDGIFRSEIDSEVVNRGMYGVFMLTGNFELFPSPQFTREAIVKEVYVNYLRGISTERGLELIEKYYKEFELRF